MGNFGLWCGVGAALALTLHAPTAFAAAVAPWIPVFDGWTWPHLESGQYRNSDGVSYSWGPERVIARFDAVDEQIIDHHATLRQQDGDYFAQNSDGLFQISQGDPRSATGEFRYYIDPEPWLIKDPLNLGEARGYTGALSGRYDFIGTWTGTWRTTFTYLGQEEVSTPLGTFIADRFEVDSERTALATSSAYRSRDYWTENWWLVEGTFIAKVMGEGGGTSDYDGDSVVDRWYQERQTLVAVGEVPESGTVHLALAGLLAMVVLRLRKSRRTAHGRCTEFRLTG